MHEAADNGQLTVKIYEIAQKLLEGVTPLKEDQILQICDLLNSVEFNSHETFDFNIVEIYSSLKDAISAVRSNLPDVGKIPISKDSDSKSNNSTYFLTDLEGKKLWVFKPEDGENSVYWT